MSWIKIDILEEKVFRNKNMSNNKNMTKKNCLVTIQNLSEDDIKLIILRKDIDGNKFLNRPSSNVIKSGKIEKYNEKILNWGQLRILQAEKKIFITYSPSAEDVFETSRFDLLDLE